MTFKRKLTTRSAMALMVIAALAIPATASATHLFADVADGHTHEEGIQFVKDAGVTIGCQDGTVYCPDDPVTRAQMATFMMRLATGEVVTPAQHSHDGSDIVDNSLTADDLSDRSRTVSIPAGLLSRDPTNPVITENGFGLLWDGSGLATTTVMMAPPDDWNGTGHLTVSVYFYPTTGNAGEVDFFMRAIGYAPGDTVSSPQVFNADAVPVGTAFVLTKQVFTIPTATLTEDVWFLLLQRPGSQETYAGDLVLMALTVTYDAAQ